MRLRTRDELEAAARFYSGHPVGSLARAYANVAAECLQHRDRVTEAERRERQRLPPEMVWALKALPREIATLWPRRHMAEWRWVLKEWVRKLRAACREKARRG